MTRREQNIEVRGKMAMLMTQVSVQFHYSPDEIRGPCRRADLVAARREFAFCARKMGMSLPRIGRALNRHHTTVLNLLR